MRIFIIPALAASLALSGCATFDTKIRENLDKACAVVEIAHETFLAIAATVPIERKYLDAVEAAYVPAHNICLHPETATTMDIVAKVITAGVRIYTIITQVTQANPAAMKVIAE